MQQKHFVSREVTEALIRSLEQHIKAAGDLTRTLFNEPTWSQGYCWLQLLWRFSSVMKLYRYVLHWYSIFFKNYIFIPVCVKSFSRSQKIHSYLQYVAFCSYRATTPVLRLNWMIHLKTEFPPGDRMH